jgi:hypothetical protein
MATLASQLYVVYLSSVRKIINTHRLAPHCNSSLELETRAAVSEEQ